MARADRDPLYERACALGLHGLCARWGEFGDAPWVPQLIEIEESERRRRSLERRLRSAKIGAVRPMADFDWKHPKKIPRGQVEELFELRFLEIKQAIYGTDEHPDVATSLDLLAHIESADGRFAEAIAASRRSLRICERYFGTSDHYAYARFEFTLAVLLLRTRCEEEALRRLLHARTVLRTNAPNNPILSQIEAMLDLPSLTEEIAKWRASGAPVEGFVTLVSLACIHVVQTALDNVEETRQRLLRELDALVLDPEPQLGSTSLVRGLQLLLRGDTLDDLPTSLRLALPPNALAVLTKIEVTLRKI